ncbi:MAG: hypothetical protein WCK57_07675 [Verrucomicrobiae bacterium]
MASLFKYPSSPFWYLRHKVDGEWKKSSTGLRHNNPNETAKARALRASAEAKEYRDATVSGSGWAWVDGYFSQAGLSPLTLIRYVAAWRWVTMFLQENRLDVSGVRYQHVGEYLTWRIGRRKNHGKAGSRNTAILEMKLLAMVMSEAVRRGMITASPLASLKLRRDPAPKKRIFTDEEIARCRSGLADCPEWMSVAFEIALCTGCRLRETRIPMEFIDLDSDVPTITFPAPKGGSKVAFSVPVPSPLIPIFRKMKADGRTHTIDAFPFQPSRRWQQFFQVNGIEGVCFHCLRATKVTLMRRQGVPREAAMRLVNHSSELIHQLYDRHQVQDLAQYSDAGIAGFSSSKSQSQTRKPSPRRSGKSGRSKAS